MEALEHLLTTFALLLAMAAALVSSDSEARREIAGFLADAFMPQTAELEADPGYLSGMATEPPSIAQLDRGVSQAGHAVTLTN